MVDLTSHGVSFAFLQGQLPAGEISRSAFLDRASSLGAGTSEAEHSKERDIGRRKEVSGQRLENQEK